MNSLKKLWKRFRKWLDDSVKPTLDNFDSKSYYDYEYSDLQKKIKKEEIKKEDKEKH